MGKVCSPVTTILPRLKFYTSDTVRRIAEFDSLRKQAEALVIEGDARTIKLQREMSASNEFATEKVSGVITSPPYVGQIDYHEQHRYAYELLGIDRRDELEIGPKTKGKGALAQREYVKSIVKVLENISPAMAPRASILLVANDKLGLYPGIFEDVGMRVEVTFERPVEDRTERDKRPYSETVFLARIVR